MNKQERLERTITGDEVDRPAAMLCRHFPGDDQRAADLARALFAFQQDFDWDAVVALPSEQFLTTGYGLTDEWQGSSTGIRTILKRTVFRSLDWTELRTLDPNQGEPGKQVECIRLLGHAFDADNTPYLQAVYSPLSQACQLAGRDTVIRHIRTHPDRLRTGLNTLTESTLRFIEALRRTGVSGIYYIVDLADYARLTQEEYLTFGQPYDLKILESVPDRWWLNAVHMRGSAPMLNVAADYPVEVYQWDDQSGHPDLEHGLRDIGHGAVCGGVAVNRHLHLGTPHIVRDAARSAMLAMDRRRLVLSAGGPIMVTTPRSNIQALRDSVEPAAR